MGQVRVRVMVRLGLRLRGGDEVRVKVRVRVTVTAQYRCCATPSRHRVTNSACVRPCSLELAYLV